MTFFTENPLRLSRVTLTSIVFPSRCHSCWTTVPCQLGYPKACQHVPELQSPKSTLRRSVQAICTFFMPPGENTAGNTCLRGFGFQARFGQRREPGLPSLSPALWTGDRGE